MVPKIDLKKMERSRGEEQLMVEWGKKSCDEADEEEINEQREGV